ncbi:homoserine O-succinyltransferase [Candidatus Saccharibacteria bacterium]|nr:homoserine O-succinyltransferase [Candidatus Saccharibacteria bacterium]
MTTWLIDNQSTSIDHLSQLLATLGQNPTIVTYSNLDSATIKPKDFIVLSGSNILTAAWNDDEFADELTLIKQHTGPMLGVCLGMQLIAHAYGAHMHQLPEKRYGLAHIKRVGSSELFNDTEYPVVFESHHWSVKKVPKPLESLAESGAGIEILGHTKKPHYGVQFHPEATDPGNGKELLDRILSNIL